MTIGPLPGVRGPASTHSTSSGLAVHSYRIDKRKLALLVERICTLEDALALESEARGGPGSHPFLTEELLAIKRVADKDNDEGKLEEDREEQILGEFGTLTINESRSMRYLGPGATEVLCIYSGLM